MIDPQRLAEMQQHTKDIKARIRVVYPENKLELVFEPSNEQAVPIVQQMLEQLSNQLAVQLGSLLSIKGEITDIGKPQ